MRRSLPILSVLVAGLLAACTVQPDGTLAPAPGFLSPTQGGLSPRAGTTAETPPARVALVEGDVVAAGPRGYCVDPTTVRSERARGFAMLASCARLSAGGTGPDVPPVLATLTVGPRSTDAALPAAETLARLADSPLLAAREGRDLVIAQLGAGGQTFLEDGDRRYWRGAFVLNGRLVSLALYAPEGSPFAGAQGGPFLQQVADSIRAATPRRAAPLQAGGASADEG